MAEIQIENVPLDMDTAPPMQAPVPIAEEVRQPDVTEVHAAPDPLPERDARLRLKDRVSESHDRKPPEIDPSLDPRMAIADKANRNRRARLLQENLSDAGTAEITLGLADDSEEYQPPAPPPKEQQESVRLRVFDQDVDVNADDVARMGGPVEAQKQLAAEAKFRRAAEERREAERIYAEANARLDAARLIDSEIERKLRTNAEAPTSASALPAQADAAVDSKSKAQEIVQSIFAGDMDSAAKALDEVLRSRQQPTDLAPVVDQVLIERQQREAQARQQEQDRSQKAAVNDLMRSKHGDILADPVLKAGALAAFNDMRANPANAGFSLVDLADAAAKHVKQKFIQPTQQAQSPMGDRERVKAGMSWQPGARSQSQQEPPPKTRSSVVQQMREARGLPN
jgi:hypothetical protein